MGRVALGIILNLFWERISFWIGQYFRTKVRNMRNLFELEPTSTPSFRGPVSKQTKIWRGIYRTILTLSILVAAIWTWKDVYYYPVWMQMELVMIIQVTVAVTLGTVFFLFVECWPVWIELYLRRRTGEKKKIYNVGQEPTLTSSFCEKKTTLPYKWYGFGLTLLIAVFIGIWLHVDIEKGVPVSARPIADQPSICQGDQDLAAVLKRKIETEAFKEQIIGPEGGSVENFGCKITFPTGAVERESKLKMSVITDFSGSPEGMAPITPILQCVLDNNLKAPVLVEMSSWAQPSESGVQGHLYRKDENSDWTFVELVSLSSYGKISFSTQHFTKFTVFLQNAIAIGGMIGGGIQAIRSLRCWHFVDNSACRAAFQWFPILLKTFLRVNADGRAAFVCCLSDPKVIGDVESSFKDCGYIYALLMPETRTVPQDKQLSLVISCNFPSTLKIRVNRHGKESTERKCERNIEVSELLNKMQHIEYFPLEINSKNLKYHKGEIRALFALKNGGLIEHPISVQWPPPILE